MNKSVILQVDEATKGLMEEVQSGLESALENSVRGIKNDVSEASMNTLQLLSKFRNFDSIGKSVEELRSLAAESKKVSDMVTPIETSVQMVGQKSDSIADGINALKEQVSETAEVISNSITQLDEKEDFNVRRISTLESKLNALEDISTSLGDELSKIKETLESMKKSIDDNQKSIKESESSVNEKLEKLQATTDIIVNFVTPFWKKMHKK